MNLLRPFLRITIANTHPPRYAWTLNGPAPSVRLTVMSVFNLVPRALFPGFEGGAPPSKPFKDREKRPGDEVGPSYSQIKGVKKGRDQI